MIRSWAAEPTLAAAEITGRACLGIKLDPKYVDVAVKRWESLAKQQATLEGDGRAFEDVARERTPVLA